MNAKKILAGICSLAMATSLVPASVMAEESAQDTIILYTNDVHCAIDEYSTLAAYAAQLEADGHEVIIIDAGDHIQGEVIGTLTEGSAIIDLMNTVGYDYAVPGNHEFDYGMDVFLNLAQTEAQFEYLSANFIDLTTDTTVFDPYEIIDLGEEQIAVVGIATPESYTKSTPTYFQDEEGNVIYGFAQDELYDTVQSAIDDAIANGADRVIAVGHLGIEGTTEGWKSTDVIANTTGIDVFLDAHAHEVIEEDLYADKNGDEVILSSTGTKFAYFGQLTLSADGVTENTELITPDSVNVESSDAAKAAYDAVQTKIDDYNAEIEYLYEVLGTAEVELTDTNPSTGEWVQRTSETNLGDFVADAYRTVSGAEIALVNSGGVRAAVEAGEVTRKDLMDVNPWNNEMCVIEATGQQILDALEHGARLYPEACGGFLQVSGLTYEICSYVESPVILDAQGSFQEIDESMERRIRNVKVNGKAIEAEKTYTVTGSLYMLTQGGDGFTMFSSDQIVQSEGLPTDADMLIQYFTEDLNGVITAAQYGSALGDGRITVVSEEQSADDSGCTGSETDSEGTATPEKSIDAAEKNTDSAVKTGDTSTAVVYCVLLAGSATFILTAAKKKKIIG